MGADKANGVVNYCRRPPHRPPLQRIQYFFYNPEEGTVLGRTPHRWGVIGLIYLVMYICIIIFFSICMCGLMATLDATVPYYTLADSIIGDNPGMGHRPLIMEDFGLIVIDSSNRTHVRKYVDNIEQFLAPYKNKSLLTNGGVKQRACGDVRPAYNEVCAFDPQLLGPCSKENDYGYANMTPCILVKLNKIFDFAPIFYNDTGSLPPDMPPDIINYINSTTTLQHRNKIWVSCKGERPADNENLGPLKYYPYPGLSEVYFPYNNTPGYLSPLVAVQLLKPKLGVIISIRCRAWAQNIRYTESLKERLGSTHIEIMVDISTNPHNNTQREDIGSKDGLIAKNDVDINSGMKVDEVNNNIKTSNANTALDHSASSRGIIENNVEGTFAKMDRKVNNNIKITNDNTHEITANVPTVTAKF